jgi:hypothetical protein
MLFTSVQYCASVTYRRSRNITWSRTNNVTRAPCHASRLWICARVARCESTLLFCKRKRRGRIGSWSEPTDEHFVTRASLATHHDCSLTLACLLFDTFWESDFVYCGEGGGKIISRQQNSLQFRQGGACWSLWRW